MTRVPVPNATKMVQRLIRKSDELDTTTRGRLDAFDGEFDVSICHSRAENWFQEWQHELNLLPFQWFDFDPMKYLWAVNPDSGSEFPEIQFNEIDKLDLAASIRIPREMGDLLKQIEDVDQLIREGKVGVRTLLAWIAEIKFSLGLVLKTLQLRESMGYLPEPPAPGKLVPQIANESGSKLGSADISHVVCDSGFAIFRIDGQSFIASPAQSIFLREVHSAGAPGIPWMEIQRRVGGKWNYEKASQIFRGNKAGPVLWERVIDHADRIYRLKRPLTISVDLSPRTDETSC